MFVTLSLFRHADADTFAAGQIIFREGEPGTKMYVVTEGEVDIRSGPNLLETAGPGSVLGEMALIDSSPRSATAVAKTDCKLVSVDERRFEFLVRETPYFALEVMQIMAERLRRTTSRIASA